MKNLNKIKEEFYSFNTVRHQNAKPPKEAYFYFPQSQDIVIHDPKYPNKTLRRIFEGNVNFLNYEKDKIKEFMQYIEISLKKTPKITIVFPDYWRDYDTLRCLQAKGYDMVQTLETLIPHLEFMRNNIPPQVRDKTIEILNLGFLYSHGRDNRFRPILVIKAIVFKENMDKYCFEDWERAIVFFIEYNIKHLLIPGQVENWNIICDLKDCSIIFLPSDLKKIIATIQANYRCRLFVMYILNLTIFLRGVWGIVKHTLDPVTQTKIQIIQPGDPAMFKFIHPSQIEERFGGKSKNFEDNFFPHISPSNQYLIEGDKPDELFVSEDKYKVIIEKDDKIYKCPFIDYSPEVKFSTEDNTQPNIEKEKVEENVKRKSVYDEKISLFNSYNTIIIEKEMDTNHQIQKNYNIRSIICNKKPKINIIPVSSILYFDHESEKSGYSSTTLKINNDSKSANNSNSG